MIWLAKEEQGEGGVQREREQPVANNRERPPVDGSRKAPPLPLLMQARRASSPDAFAASSPPAVPCTAMLLG